MRCWEATTQNPPFVAWGLTTCCGSLLPLGWFNFNYDLTTYDYAYDSYEMISCIVWLLISLSCWLTPTPGSQDWTCSRRIEGQNYRGCFERTYQQETACVERTADAPGVPGCWSFSISGSNQHMCFDHLAFATLAFNAHSRLQVNMIWMWSQGGNVKIQWTLRLLAKLSSEIVWASLWTRSISNYMLNVSLHMNIWNHMTLRPEFGQM